MPGFNSFMGYDPTNQVTLVVWTNLTVSLDGKVDGQCPHVESARSDLRAVTAPPAVAACGIRMFRGARGPRNVESLRDK